MSCPYTYPTHTHTHHTFTLPQTTQYAYTYHILTTHTTHTHPILSYSTRTHVHTYITHITHTHLPHTHTTCTQHTHPHTMISYAYITDMPLYTHPTCTHMESTEQQPRGRSFGRTGPQNKEAPACLWNPIFFPYRFRICTRGPAPRLPLRALACLQRQKLQILPERLTT